MIIIMDINLLEQLSRASGVSGSEAPVRDIILKAVQPYAEKTEITPLGNLIVYKKGRENSGKTILLSAHMDEVGMVVTHIDKEGFAAFAPIGGIDSAVLLGKSVLVNGTVPGVIGGKPVHLMSGDEFEKAVPMDKLRIDIGAKNQEEAKASVSVGDIVTFLPFFENSHGTVKGKALDDRVGCLLLVELIRADLPFDTVFCFSVQEEVGMRGAQTAAQLVNPDIVIAIEGTVAGDVLGGKGAKAVTLLGKGPAVSIVDRGTVYDQGYFRAAFETAKALNIPCQARTGAAGSNDAGAMHKAGAGARAMAVSVPCRYIHCPVSIASESDIDGAFRLIQAMLAKLPSL